jgi:hypothetical protein
VQYRIRLSIGSYYSFSRTIRLRAKVDPQLALTNPFSDVLQVGLRALKAVWCK